MKLIATLALAISFLSICQAQTTEPFYKRFNYVKREGKVIQINDSSLNFSFRIAPYVSFLKEHLKQEQELIKRQGFAYGGEIEELLSDDLEHGYEKSSENIRIVVDSLKALEGVDIEEVFNHPGFKEVLSAFEQKLSDALNLLDPRAVANLDDPTFFYKRNVTYQVVKWALDFAKKRLSSLPILNTASYVLVEVERLIREQRLFHQNMLLHYLERFPEEQLGLTKSEADRAFSSIYESRIDWYAFWESKAAKNNWDRYGTDRFFASFRMGTNKLRRYKKMFSTVDERMNYAFQKVSLDGNDLIINLVDKESMFNSKPALAFDYSDNKRIIRKRILLQLAGLGLSFIPLPSLVKDIADSYMKSHYYQQKITEGALYGYFESMELPAQKEAIWAQYLNPFDQVQL